MELGSVRTSGSRGAIPGMGARKPGDTGGAHNTERQVPKLRADGEACAGNRGQVVTMLIISLFLIIAIRRPFAKERRKLNNIINNNIL